MLGLIKRSYTFLDKDSLLCISKAMVHPILEYGVTVVSPYRKGDIDAVESVQRRATRILPEFRGLNYEARLRSLKLPTLTYCRLRGDDINMYKYIHGIYRLPLADNMFEMEHAALELIDRVITEIDKGEIPFNIYIYLSKAFDTLDHAILMDKLYYYAVQGTSLDILRSYLVKRKQYVQIGGVKSDITYLSTGVPQGSILGPLLFIIHINDNAKCSNLLHTIIYADDTTLMGNISTFELRNGRTLDENIHFELLKLTDWLKVNKLSLNANKTKLMIFHMPQRKLNPPIITIDEIQLEPISNFNL